MNESIIISDTVREQISAKTGLVGLGIKVRQMEILAAIEEVVKIDQKTQYLRQLCRAGRY